MAFSLHPVFSAGLKTHLQIEIADNSLSGVLSHESRNLKIKSFRFGDQPGSLHPNS